MILKAGWISLVLIFSCSTVSDGNEEDGDTFVHAEAQAAVTAVSASGNSGAFNFSVTISSPDEGCSQYADWWEVITPDSLLIYRRILAHSHIDEQPFTRSGGPVDVDKNDQVLIRAHMSNLGYGSRIFSGSVADGFSNDTLGANFGLALLSQNPLPASCAF